MAYTKAAKERKIRFQGTAQSKSFAISRRFGHARPRFGVREASAALVFPFLRGEREYLLRTTSLGIFPDGKWVEM